MAADKADFCSGFRVIRSRQAFRAVSSFSEMVSWASLSDARGSQWDRTKPL